MRCAITFAFRAASPPRQRVIAHAITLACARRIRLRTDLVSGGTHASLSGWTRCCMLALPLLIGPALPAAAQPVGIHPDGADPTLPACLQAPIDELHASGVRAMVVIADRSRTGAVDSAGSIWRQHHPDLLVWSGPSGVHVMARWLSYAESRRLAKPYIGLADVCDLAQLLRTAGERRTRTVVTLALVGTTALILMLLAIWRAPRAGSQNSK